MRPAFRQLRQQPPEILLPRLLRRGPEKGGVGVSEEFFRNLAAYKAAMSLAKGMLHQGIISESEYAEIDTIMTKKYGLSLDSIFRTIA